MNTKRTKKPQPAPAPTSSAAVPASLGSPGSWHVPAWSVADFYYDVWGDGTGRIWAVGQVWAGRKGIAFSPDFGRSWTAQDRPNKMDLQGIHGDGAGTVWAVGKGGTVLRASYDPCEWKRQRAGLD